MIIFYHSDLDGHCAGAIAYKFATALDSSLPDLPRRPLCVEMDHFSTLDLNSVENGENIYIVDFSFKPDVINKLLEKGCNITWLDHHKTAFDYEKKFIRSRGSVNGFRRDDLSGCGIAWNWFFPHSPMPYVVEMIQDYDLWQFKFPETKPFYEGLKLEDTAPIAGIWKTLLCTTQMYSKHEKDIISDFCKKGETCIKYRDSICKDYCKMGFETWFMGYRCFAQGMYTFGSTAFGELIHKYPICLSFEFLGDKWVIGLYSADDKIHVGELAKQCGGGGHKGAAGFTMNGKDLPDFLGEGGK